MQVSEKTSQNIIDSVESDLAPSVLRVLAYLALAFGVGGGFSMLFCGQFGIGFSSFAIHFSHTMHAQMDAFVCALICGGVFAFVPVLILRATTHPLLFRVILQRYRLVEAGFSCAVGLLAYSHGDFKMEMLHIGVWVFSAFSVFQGLGFFVDRYCGKWAIVH